MYSRSRKPFLGSSPLSRSTFLEIGSHRPIEQKIRKVLDTCNRIIAIEQKYSKVLDTCKRILTIEQKHR
jgi:hypothetical protein